ncbi:kinase-like domain-containing protein [Melampsora americana]|nr:kinase-like domain-containing protein [Melampsora americana]
MKRRLSTSTSPSLKSSFTIDSIPTNKSLTQIKSISNYKIGKVIGEGTSAIISLAEHIQTKKLYVIKTFKTHQRSDKSNLRERIQQEIKIFKSIDDSDHPFIINFQGFILNQIEMSLILEYLDGPNLLQKLEIEGPLNESNARFYTSEIACGISFLHSKRIIVVDLKLDNLMIAMDGHIKLIDFGLSEILQGSYLSIPCGAMHIRPPEMIRRKAYSFNVDWYALGICLFELLTNHEPFFQRNYECLPSMILEIEVNYPKNLSKNCINFISFLIHKNHQNRLQSFSDLQHHPWFNKIDWKKVHNKLSIPPRSQLSRACKKIRTC